MTQGLGRRGQPLLVLGALLLGWIGLRIAVWESPLQIAEQASTGGGTEASTVAASGTPTTLALPEPTMTAVDPFLLNRTPSYRSLLQARFIPKPFAWDRPVLTEEPPRDQAEVPQFAPQRSLAPLPRKSRHASPALAPPLSPARNPVTPSARRWQVDGWLLWRERDSALGQTAATRPASYGNSQIGTIIRYRLGDRGAPFVFARASKALVNQGETDLAMGAGLRPLKQMPLAVYAEARASEFNGNWSLRPAAYLVTELPPIKVTKKVEAEAYLQAGYVGGDFDTPFADGQAKIERHMATVEGVELRLGAGTWGGVQEGAERIDVGPTASARFHLGEVPVRLSADYRFRAAGDAAPGSGVAVTLSSGF